MPTRHGRVRCDVYRPAAEDRAGAPQVRFPVASEQAHDVAAWLAAQGERIGVDGGRVAVGGFSAGGNLAAAVALEARDRGTFSPPSSCWACPCSTSRATRRCAPLPWPPR